MTDNTQLSPAAQAVLDAFGTCPLRADHISKDLILALAAALRAAADHLDYIESLYEIAAELENHV